MKSNQVIDTLWMKKIEPFFSSKYGIISNFYVIPLADHMPRLFNAAGKVTNISLFSGFPMDFNIGGCGEDEKSATLAAFGEALERYSASVIPARDLISGSFMELVTSGKNCLLPDYFNYFTEQQYREEGFGLKPFTPESPLRWAKGEELATGREIWLPASMVYIPYIYQPGEERINHITSTGLAFGFSKEAAVLSGLCEVIERDAFAISWMAKISPPKVDFLNCGAPSVERLLKKSLKQYLDKITVLDITTDIGLPSFIAFLETGSHELPAVSFGAASNPDKERALYKALLEMAQTYIFAWHLKNKNEFGEKLSFAGEYNREITDFDKGVLMYSYEKELDKISFLKDNPKVKDFRDIRDYKKNSLAGSIEMILKLLEDKGFSACCADITSGDIRNAGGYVVRILIPGLLPLHGAYRYRHLGHPRLYSVPHILGYYNRPLKEEDLNLDPHPFP